MLVTQAADIQAVAATAVTIVWQGVDSDGEPADPGTVTVGVTNSAGDTVVAAGTATVVDGTKRTYALTATQTASIDVLTASFSSGGNVVGTVRVEIVGAPLITRAEFQSLQKLTQEKSPEQVIEVRRQVDAFFLDKLKWAMTPRLAVERIHSVGRRELVLHFPHLREVRWARKVNSDGTRTTIANVDQVAASGAAIADFGPYDCWPVGDIEIAYVHGTRRPSDDAKRVIARLMKAYLGEQVSTLDDRTQTFSDGTGATYSLAVEGRNGVYSSIPTVNEFIRANRREVTGIA